MNRTVMIDRHDFFKTDWHETGRPNYLKFSKAIPRKDVGSGAYGETANLSSFNSPRAEPVSNTDSPQCVRQK